MRTLILFLLLSCWAPFSVDAQKPAPARVDFGEEFFDEANVSLNNLLGLKWDNGRLKLRRDWEPEKKEQDNNDRIRRAIARSPFENELRKVTKKLGGRGYGRSGNGTEMNINVRCPEYFVMARIKEQNYFVEIFQDKTPYQRFTFEENGNGRLCITLTNESEIIRAYQNDVGLLTLSIFNDDLTSTFKAKSFKDLFENQPEAAKLFVKCLNHVHIEQPLSTVSNEVQQFIKEKLIENLPSRAESDELKGLVDQLDADTYSVRSAATEVIKNNFNNWRAELQVLAQQDSLSIETRMRLKNIIDSVNVERWQKKSVRDFAEQNELLKNDEFLFSLADESDQQLMAAIIKQVQRNNPESTEATIKKKYETWKTTK